MAAARALTEGAMDMASDGTSRVERAVAQLWAAVARALASGQLLTVGIAVALALGL